MMASSSIPAETYDATSRRVPLADLDRCDCHWPVNDAAPGEVHLFCGAPVAGEKTSYCRHHFLRSIGSGTMGEQMAPRTLEKLGRAA